jgi:ribonuclease VapC
LILDSSAAVSVIFREENHRLLSRTMSASLEVAIGAPTLFETELVVTRRHDRQARLLVAEFLEEHDVAILPFDGRHWDLAADAFVRFGKGRHPARLNYGDCMTYATARVASEPLLFVGEDFGHTDLTPVLV